MQAGCALLGGETAEHPGADGATATTTCPRPVSVSSRPTGARARPGPSRATSSSPWARRDCIPTVTRLARKVLLEIDRMNLTAHVEEFGRTLGEELLEPTKIYAKDCLALIAETDVRTFCHVTGGGLANNLARVMPKGLVAELDRGTWSPAPVFAMIAQRGRVERAEMEQTFNMGVGMVAIVAPEDVDRALAVLTARHIDCWTLGSVKKSHKRRRPSASVLVGEHPRF